MTSVRARAPNRIDLGGGTLDIDPLGRILPGSLTVNLAISIGSEVEISETKGPTRITSDDLGRSIQLETLATAEPEPEFRLILAAVRALSPPGPLEIRTCNEAPRGSGLGASSALSLCLVGAMAHLLRRPRTLGELVRLSSSVEVGVLQAPTGTQDQYAAALGGALALHYLPGGIRVERLPLPQDFQDALEETILLSFTGAPHDSGAINWSVVRAAIDGPGRTRKGLEKIREIAREIREAFLNRDLRKVGRLVAADGAERRKLSRGVVPPEIDRVMKEARRAGALGSRLSGAGGGGTLITVVPPARKPEVLRCLGDAGFTPLSWSPSPRGLQVER